MTTVYRLPTHPGVVTIDAAVTAFLDTLCRPEQQSTRRTYADVLTQLLRSPLSRSDSVGMLDDPVVAEQLRGWFAARWGPSAGSTWNRNLAALRSACSYWRTEQWIITDPTAGLRRATPPENRARARSRTAIADLLTRPDLALRDRTLWALLYESAARAQEVLLLDVTDLDRPNRQHQ